MLLIYTQKLTPRIDYIFKQICCNMLGIEISFTSEIEKFISHNKPKISYGKVPLGSELFFESHGLLSENKIEPVSIDVSKWGYTYGFFRASDKSALSYDIFAASFYLITRYEEYLPYIPDEFGSFPVEQSLAYEYKFLEQPIIDYWADMLLNMILVAFPKLRYKKAPSRINTLIEAKQPFAYANQALVNIIYGYIKEISQWKIKDSVIRTQTLLGLKRDPYDTFSWIIQNTKMASKRLIVFFMLGDAAKISERQNTNSPIICQKIKFVGDYEEIGIVFSKDAILDHQAMKDEKTRMEAITHRPVQCSMFEDNMLKFPDAYRGLIQLEIEKDYSMVYPTAVGYRAGTCSEFLFYDLEHEVKTPLIISPVAISSNALKQFGTDKTESLVQEFYEQTANLGGELNFMFSNQDFSFSHSDNSPFWKNLFINQLKL